MGRAYKIGSVIVVGAVVLLGITTFSFAVEQADYYRHIMLDGTYSIVGRYPVDDELADEVNCYHFVYDDSGRVLKVEYFKGGSLAIDPYFGVAQIVFEHLPLSNSMSFFDVFGNPIENDDGVCFTEIIYEKVNSILVSHYDNEGKLIEGKDGVAKYLCTVDDGGRSEEIIFFDEYDNRIYSDFGIFEIRRKYNEYGYVSQESYHDKSGNLRNLRIGSYYSYFDDYSRYAIVRYKYDGQGNRIEETFYDFDGELKCLQNCVAIIRYEYGEYGNLVKESHHDTDGQLIEDKLHTAMIRWKYDDRGNVLEESYFGDDGKLKKIKSDKYAKIMYKYDEQGNMTDKSYYGLDNWSDEDYCIYSVYKWKYDVKGNMIEESRFDADGSLILKGEYKYDEQNNNVEKIYYNAEGRLVCISRYDDIGNRIESVHYDDEYVEESRGIAIYRWKYDEQGNLIEESYYGPDGQLKEFYLGYAKKCYEYDEQGNRIETRYYGADDKLFNRGRPYVIETKYDEYGNKIEYMKYDADDNLVENEIDGTAIFRWKYDERGNLLEYAFYGVDEQLRICWGVRYALKRMKYDESGNNIKVSFYGADGELTEPDGIATIRWKYDDYRNKIEESYYGTDGQLKEYLFEGVIAITRWKYNKYGKKIEVSYYGDDEKLKMNENEGYAIIRYKYDEIGRCIEVSYYGVDGELREFKYDLGSVSGNYDDYGNIIERVVYGSSHQVVFLHIWKYDEQGNLIDDSFCDIRGLSEEIHNEYYAIVRYEYDEEGRYTAIYLDKDEQVVKIESR